MKSNNIILFIIAIIFSNNCSYGQIFTIYKDKVIGTTLAENELNSILLNSNDILVAGETNASVNIDKTDPLCDTSIIAPGTDIWLFKMDSNFNIIWDKSIGGSKSESEAHVFINKDNQIAIICESSSDSSCEKSQNDWFANSRGDYWEIILDTLGNKIWDKSWGGTKADQSPQMVQFPNGNYLICGQSGSPISGDKTVANCTNNYTDLWTIMTDSIGNKIWDRVYGGDNNDNAIGWGTGLKPNLSILKGLNNSAIITARTISTNSCDISDTSRGNYDIWVLKIDSSGNKLWDKRYGNSNSGQYPEIIDANDGGYILLSSCNGPSNGDVTDTARGSNNIWVVKLDSMGNKIWDKRYGGITVSNTLPSEIKPALDGGYYICGNVSGDSAYDVSENSYGMTDYWIFKIDDNGNKLWDKRYGGPSYDNCYGMLLPQDTSIILYGTARAGISPVKTDSGIGQSDYWFIHFKYTDTTSTVGFIDPIAFDESVSLYPNPASDVVTIASNKTQIQNITMYNLLGELIETKNYTSSHNIQFDLQTYPKGVYIAKITGQQSTVARKVVKN